jgi:catechol 2,3-dioxygenase-like lactoylglutathione lyase family enzyme
VIQGLYEAHLPVSDLDRSIAFYEGLGLPLALRAEAVAFVWIEEGRSWLGLWRDPERAATPYHPSLRHVAFRVAYPDLLRAVDWLRARGIEPRADEGFWGREPSVRPRDGTGSLYFNDPDGNSLELICNLPGPRQDWDRMYLSEWLRAGGGTRHA